MKQIILDLWTNKRMVLSLAKNDFKQRFAGSYFGIMWAFVNPVVTIMLYWFVFTIGFRNPPVKRKLSVCFMADCRTYTMVFVF